MNGTQLSNPRTAKGRPLRCPDCGAYAHAADTKCAAELTARGKQGGASEADVLRNEYATINEHKGKCGMGQYGHNVIMYSLRIIAEKFGKAEANRAIRECGLVERGWTEEPE